MYGVRYVQYWYVAVTIHVGEVSHYAYLVLKHFPPFPTEIEVLCHHAKRDDIFLLGGRVGPSPLTKMNKI